MYLRPRVIFLNRYFFPDHSASSQILSGLAFHLARSGADVHVVTSRQLYDDPQGRLPSEEITDAVHIHRVATTNFGRSGLSGRSLDYASFYVSMARSLRKLARPQDVIVAMTDPPLLSIVAARVARRRGAKLVNWLQDLYPEVAVQLGVSLIQGPLSRLLSMLRDQSLRTAAINVVVGQGMADRLVGRGIPADRIQVIHNWCDDDSVRPIEPSENPLRREWGLEDKFVVGYSGNLGRAHEFATVLEASEHLKADDRIVFVLIGGGHQFEAFARAVKERGLERMYRFMPYQHQNALRYSLGVADVHWISLRPDLEGLIVPSKFYGVAAAGRPIIAIGAKNGELSRLIDRHACGFTVAPGDADAFLRALALLSSDAESRAAMGARARAMLDENFSRRLAFQRWHGILDMVLRDGLSRFADLSTTRDRT
jgi:glycosyltransferase involved in cell wall biosynthesis